MGDRPRPDCAVGVTAFTARPGPSDARAPGGRIKDSDGGEAGVPPARRLLLRLKGPSGPDPFRETGPDPFRANGPDVDRKL
mmetsp:Transcript_23991/g.52189  ORF Transcript_23991/g.52189 Transcript_23991/m.52189 type:complete len:81 (-) Transcript_23991:111-353(-)